MSSEPPVLGIDLGTATVAAGYAIPGEQPEPLNMHIRSKRPSPHYRSEVLISDENIVSRPDYKGTVAGKVGNLTSLLGRPPQIIAGAPYGVNNLIEMLVAPALDAADRISTPIERIAAVVPAHWPDYTVEQYCRALASTGLNVTPVSAAESLASYAELMPTDGLVTCYNIGTQAATLTMAVPDGERRYNEVHEVSVEGGMDSIAQNLVLHIAGRIAPNFQPSEAWLEEAEQVGKRILRASQKADSPQALITAELPEPLKRVKVKSAQINDLAEDLMRQSLETLATEEVHNLWQDDVDAGIHKTLLVTGGFSTYRPIGNAMRTYVGPWKAQRHPEAIAAMGAARFVAEGRA